jgi:hypothetical protein
LNINIYLHCAQHKKLDKLIPESLLDTNMTRAIEKKEEARPAHP